MHHFISLPIRLIAGFCCVVAPVFAQKSLPDTTAHRSQIAFQLSQTGLITEGIAYDPSTKTFYVSSVRERRIISYSASQEIGEFSRPADSLWGVFGMKVDPVRRLLWTCSSALPQAKGTTAAEQGRAAIVAYDLRTRKLRHRYPVPADGKPHLLGDLTIAPNGDVYTTDSRTPWIYRLSTNSPTLAPFLTDSLFRSLQGLTFSDDGQTLYVADYRNGPLAVNPTTKQVKHLTWPASADLSGVDGMYYYKNSLITIQNRKQPYRVSRLYLDKTGSVIERVNTLMAGHPLVTEPTLGVIVGNQFYYIANSQWDAFDEAGKTMPNYPAQKPTVLMLTID